ncbi:MAG TPA: cytochrome c peroxidase [Candidatus Sulfopaludibacter sp.]|nr:cytochrome c peroxidase [Candidatus Sulfopaludibacter sp.]
MTKPIHLVCAAIVLLLSAACTKSTSTSIDPERLKAFAPLPDAAAPAAGAQVELGRMLYYEKRLSKNQDVSCNTCHPLAKFGADGQPTSEGHAGQHGTRNSPTVYNAALQFVQFWDGRAADVEAQAAGPMLNPVEMAMPSEKAVLEVLNSMPGYVEAFRQAYPDDKDPMTMSHVTAAIGTFERGLTTPSRWDKFLKGDEAALTPAEKAGFNQFADAGCALCHSGKLVGGGAFQKLGVMKEYPDKSDPGRFNVTKNESDRLVFKVPSLRNIARTGPYFHDGKVRTLETALAMMAEYQTGMPLNAASTDGIVVWLQSLTGDTPEQYVREPELPQSTARTPKPVAGI